MHTKTIKIKIDGKDETWAIHHNGDWSGDAIIHREGKPFSKDISIPCAVLVACGADAMRDKIISAIEQLPIPGEES